MQKNKLFLLLFFVGYGAIFSQKVEKDTVQPIAKIVSTKNNNAYSFSAQKPPLTQIAGAPKAFYSHYWEFGDGFYSMKETPNHTYKEPGDYEVKLWATNNYDSGKTPTTRPQKVSTNDKASTVDNEIQIMDDVITLKRNREPLPEEDFVVILSYKNEKNYVTNGTLYFYYNERDFKNDNFELLEIRNYNNENISDLNNDIVYSSDFDTNAPSYASIDTHFPARITLQDTTYKKNLPITLEQAKQKFKKAKMISFANMNPNEQRNIFFTLKTTPEMIKDTSAILKVRSIYVPDANYENHKVKDMEMEIVTSHDPNKMSTNGVFINYRRVRSKRVNFKTRFQNNGEGPATTIRLETDVPDMFDKATLQIEAMYPECRICPKNEEVRYSCLDTIIKQKQIIFTFKNIYLPGSEQKNVVEKDSTKGFVKYSLMFGKDFHKINTKSQTAIIFDKNEPIITNYSTTRFMPGISIGARAGYTYTTQFKEATNFFLGATISPYKSYRWYWQSELAFSRFQNSNIDASSNYRLFQFSPPYVSAPGIVYDFGYEKIINTTNYKTVSAEVVPVSIRYNVNNYIGLGLGPQFSTVIADNSTRSQIIKNYEAVPSPANDYLLGAEIPEFRKENRTAFSSNSKLQTQFFVDATFGFARIGPSAGVRYFKNLNSDFDSWQFYAIWKF